MTDEAPYGDPLSAPFWAAARRHELVVQRCVSCGSAQFYPRPFCIACSSDEVEWVPVTGAGVVYSLTTVHLALLPELEPPYAVALVDLDAGPRLVANVADGCKIGDRVALQWRPRGELPPLPVFVSAKEEAHGAA